MLICVSTDAERREIAEILAAYGAPLLHFADLIAGAHNEDVHVGAIAGPIPDMLLEQYETRALVVSGFADGSVAVVGLDRLRELVADQDPVRFASVIFSNARRVVDSASLLLIHDGSEVVAAVGYDGPLHASPVSQT